MIIAIFILQKMHQIEISPLSHKYHILLRRGSMCRNSVETFWGLLWFFLSTQRLSLVLSPFPAEQGGGLGGQENFVATGDLFPWEWAKWAKGRGRNWFFYFFFSPLAFPLFSTLCWQHSSSPITTNPRASPPSAFNSFSHLPSCLISAQIWAPQTVQECRLHRVISCLCYLSPQRGWGQWKAQRPLLFLAQHDNFESRFNGWKHQLWGREISKAPCNKATADTEKSSG